MLEDALERLGLQVAVPESPGAWLVKFPGDDEDGKEKVWSSPGYVCVYKGCNVLLPPP